MIDIRRIIGPMPYDYGGKHATGREVWRQAASGTWCWMPEYEGDETEELPETEDIIEYNSRLDDAIIMGW